jgi:peptidyl-prolyl cis-trans isomerase A (cyclophilin A)
MKGPSFALASAFAVIALAGCSKTNPEPGNTTTGSTTPTTAAVSAPAKPSTGKGVAQLDPAKATEKAPDQFKAKFTTTKGDFVIEVHRDWSPNGADRFYNLVKMGFYDDTRFFRAIDGFMVQFGINGDPAVNTKWQGARFQDDPGGKQSNKPGYVSFATMGPNSRTTQIFINYGDNTRLDGMGFTPFGKVVEGMDVVNALYKGYGEGAPGGMGPSQGRIQSEGNAYLDKSFPKLDAVKEAKIVP